jgi:hypothetical protein
MNDNHTALRPVCMWPREAYTAETNPCFCDEPAPLMDAETATPPLHAWFFVWCPRCGAEGPRMLTQDTARAGWNVATAALCYRWQCL